ncbi:MAG: 4Fe-4S binding protein [Synergistaceae bacterium]|nr:4Fe-4S binding protein [Synergistaceae bacterium]
MNPMRLRMLIQFAFLAFMTWTGYRHQVVGGGPTGVPPVDALCPLGGMESLYSLLASGTWLRRVAPSYLILLVIVALATLLFGRVFCGWICPLGTIGEWTAKISRRLGIRPREMPEPLDRQLRFLKYAVFAMIIAFTWKLGTLAWRPYDPWVAWMHLSAGLEGMAEAPWSFVVLFVTVIGASLFVERFWCRYLCPLGALLAPLQKLSLFKVRRSEEHCIHCHLCGKSCPVRLNPESTDVTTSAECLACGRCVEACPREKALFFGTRSKALSVTAIGLLGVGLYLGGYGLARAANLWSTYAPPPAAVIAEDPASAVFGWMTVEKVSETVGLPAEKVLAITGLPADTPLDKPIKEITDDEAFRETLQAWFAAQKESRAPVPPPSPANPEEIKGSMTLRQVAETYGVEERKVLEKAGWPLDLPSDKPLKDLAAELGKEVAEIRQAVKELQGKP